MRPIPRSQNGHSDGIEGGKYSVQTIGDGFVHVLFHICPGVCDRLFKNREDVFSIVAVDYKLAVEQS